MQGEAERLQQFARTMPISTTINSHERETDAIVRRRARSTKSHWLNCGMRF